MDSTGLGSFHIAQFSVKVAETAVTLLLIVRKLAGLNRQKFKMLIHVSQSLLHFKQGHFLL